MADDLLGFASLGVWVLNDVGQPMPQISVRLVYQNYSAEGTSHEVTLTADDNGHVLFPPQYEKASIFQHVLFVMSSAMAGVHASFGRHAHVFAFGGGYEGIADADWQGYPESMQSRIGGHPSAFEQPAKP
jgi:hypothetical protein